MQLSAVTPLSRSLPFPPSAGRRSDTGTRRPRPLCFSKTLENPNAAATLYPSVSRRAAVSALKESKDLRDSLSRLNAVLAVQDLNIVLRHLGDEQRWSEVSQLFDWMKEHDQINFASYSSFIKYMGKSRYPVKALQIYNSIADESVRYDVSVCNSILVCLLRNGKFESGIKLFEEMKANGLVPDLITYSTLLSGCIKAKQGYTKAMQLVSELESNGLHMDAVIYGTLLAICVSNNLCEEAELFFEQIKAEGLHPNLYHYSSLLNAYSVNGNYLKADNLMQDLKSTGLVPNKVILTTLLKVYIRGGLLERSKELLSELESLGYAEEEVNGDLGRIISPMFMKLSSVPYAK